MPSLVKQVRHTTPQPQDPFLDDISYLTLAQD
jgi:hypothetical protein